jgi:hypothetical protein
VKVLLPTIILSTIIGAPLLAFGEGWVKAIGALCFVLWIGASSAALFGAVPKVKP